MIHVPCTHGQSDWHWLRLGLPTASQMGRILTPKKREYAAGAQSYIAELLAETFTGIPHDAGSNAFMERGSELEDKARAFYLMENGGTLSDGGVCLLDSKLAACSPDFLVGDDGGGEIKCRNATKHVAALLEGDSEAFAQVQACLWITGRKWWDLVSFNPLLPSTIQRVQRDEAYIAALDKAMHEQFLPALQRARQALLALGAKPATRLAQEFASSLAMRPDASDPF